MNCLLLIVLYLIGLDIHRFDRLRTVSKDDFDVLPLSKITVRSS